MTVRRGTYWHATKCVGYADDTTKRMQSYLLTRFPAMRNGGIYGCRNIAGTSILSTHATGRTADTMTGTGKPTVESLFVAEQMRIFSLEMGIQGIIHARRQWFCNLVDTFVPYNGSNPHDNHNHWERIPGMPLTDNQIKALFQGHAPTGDKLAAQAVVKLGSVDGDKAWGPVRYVQTRLREHGCNLTVDGVFGPETDAWVKVFQHLCGIAEDGIAGAVTQGRLQ